MKLLPILLLNLATATAAVVVYDQVRPAPPTPSVMGGSHHAAVAALEVRIAALEADHGVQLGGGGTDPRVLDRLDALEDATRTDTATAVPSTPAGEVIDDASSPPPEEITAPPSSPEAPSREAVRTWRRLREAVRREDIVKRNRLRFDRALGTLPFQLTPRQRAKVYDAYAGFEPRIGKIWREIRTQATETQAAGGTIDRLALAAQGNARIQQEFAEAIGDIVHQVDAVAISKAMLANGR